MEHNYMEENEVKSLRNRCLDCGSEAVNTVLDDMGPAFKMEIIHFACGAKLQSTIVDRGRVVKACHSGCDAHD